MQTSGPTPGPEPRKSGPKGWWARRVGGPKGGGPEGWGARRVGGPKGGGPEGWGARRVGGPKGGGPEGWGARKVEPRKVEPRKVEPRKVEPRKVEPRKVEPRKLEPRKVEPRKVVGPKFRAFFPLRHKIRSFLPSLGGLLVELWWCLKAGNLKCARLEFSGCRVRPAGNKKREILGPPPFGPPSPSGPHFLLGLGPRLQGTPPFSATLCSCSCSCSCSGSCSCCCCCCCCCCCSAGLGWANLHGDRKTPFPEV